MAVPKWVVEAAVRDAQSQVRQQVKYLLEICVPITTLPEAETLHIVAEELNKFTTVLKKHLQHPQVIRLELKTQAIEDAKPETKTA